jgi:hypothetical protein
VVLEGWTDRAMRVLGRLHERRGWGMARIRTRSRFGACCQLTVSGRDAGDGGSGGMPGARDWDWDWDAQWGGRVCGSAWEGFGMDFLFSLSVSFVEEDSGGFASRCWFVGIAG